MIRAPIGKKEYWDKWIDHKHIYIKEVQERIKQPSGNPSYRPQYIFELVIDYLKLILRRYSRGDAVSELAQYFSPLLDAWEKSELLGKDVWTKEQQYTRHAWVVNLDSYNHCFWLVGLALILEIPEEQWQRLLVLIDNEGEDELLDRVIASRQSERKIGNKLCYPKPYQRLLDAINAPKEHQAKLLREFVDKWYKELKQPGKKGMTRYESLYLYPYWYKYIDRGLESGWYFGNWCIEAVAAVKAFGLDDLLCLGHEHYPGDLLRPNGPSTHQIRNKVSSPDNRKKASSPNNRQ